MALSLRINNPFSDTTKKLFFLGIQVHTHPIRIIIRRQVDSPVAELAHPFIQTKILEAQDTRQGWQASTLIGTNIFIHSSNILSFG